MSKLLFGSMILLQAVVGPGCSRPVPEEAVSVSHQAEREAILAVSEAEFKAVAEGDVDAHLAVLGEDAVILPPNQPAIFDKAAFGSSSRSFYSRYRMERFEHSREELVVAGDWAFERWTVSMAVVSLEGGEPVPDQVKGIHIYHRQSDGNWKLVRDIWNSDRPVSKPENP